VAQFTYGHPVIIHSDHKPLQSITRKPLDKAPKRLQAMLVRALAYDIDVRYLKGKKMFLADTLSRAYLTQNDDSAQSDFEIINAVNYLPMRKERMHIIRRETQSDPSLQLLKETIQQGWPESHQVPSRISEYFSIRDKLAVTDRLIFKGERLVTLRGV